MKSFTSKVLKPFVLKSLLEILSIRNLVFRVLDKKIFDHNRINIKIYYWFDTFCGFCSPALIILIGFIPFSSWPFFFCFPFQVAYDCEYPLNLSPYFRQSHYSNKTCLYQWLYLCTYQSNHIVSLYRYYCLM